MNNLKIIREIYGATQEQVAKALGVNRVTIANWEAGTAKASSSSREKMSLYYGIGPEYFYDKEIDDNIKDMLYKSAERARKVVDMSRGEKNKEEDFQKLFTSTSFESAMKKYMFAMKIMLAVADEGELELLRTAYIINKKMGERLAAIIKLREEEKQEKGPSLKELLDKFEE